MLLSASVLFAVDAVAVRLGASTRRRSLICAIEVYALYNVLLWGHPEDAVAVALLLYGCLAASEKRWSRFGWLMGAAVAFQPVVLLALPPLLLAASWRRVPGVIARMAAPTALLLAMPLAMNWSTTVHAFLDQPTFPSLNRPTPWLHLASTLGHYGYIGSAAAPAAADGPFRLMAICSSLILAIVLRRAVRQLGALLAVVALTLSSWCAFETVIAPYYVWPTIAVAVISLSTASRVRSAITLVLAIVADLASNADLHAEWMWWVIIAALAALIVASWPARTVDSPEPRLPAVLEPSAAQG